ncbi:NAD(P)/FAD-dependent oxidoreductase [Burkholderia sp. Bp9140]|uniref:NAD(P)/FAD-dependent oxidoreductase n=1 Tax=Burkholderia sp. Bp9140 TaxID=2184572 RepID=UPI000F573C73|nr:FAD/NAD(P)-binding oxidoreductase [Burkholderia sp. Bp9140]RQR51352.1 NAD(P)/FAD-dependent oxidoreductase [Burkholderia sp. Bp9140]
MGSYSEVLIVGSGHAGAQAAICLRQGKFAGSITIVGEEPDLPYERPPLSKEYLTGTKDADQVLIRPASFWQSRGIVIMAGRRVEAVYPDRHRACLDDGLELEYAHLVWAAGSRPRRLHCPGADLHGVHYIRTRAHADAILRELESVKNIVIVGGGYIGLEAAATFVKLGKRVAVIESQDRVLARVTVESMSRFFESEHRARGVGIHLGTNVEAFKERGGRVSDVALSNGVVLPAEMVVIGVGVVPVVEPLLVAGATGAGGVAIDRQCRTSLADIFAAGDCTLHENAYAPWLGPVRLESVQNAFDQAAVAAGAILGGQAEYSSVPWFWSNQFDLRLQSAGLSVGHDSVVIRGDPLRRAFSQAYFREGRLIAMDCVNSAGDFAQAKNLIMRRAVLDMTHVGDPTKSLKDLVC